MNLRVLLFRPIALYCVIFTLASPAYAQSTDEADIDDGGLPRDGGKVVLAASYRADHSDSDAPKASLLPAVEYQWANGWSVGTNRGVGYTFSANPALQYGLGLGVDFGRKASTTGALAGMGGIDAKLEVGGFLNYSPTRNLRLSSMLRHGSGDTGDGTTVNLGFTYGLAIAPRWRIGTGLSATWANAQYMQSYYGVSAVQSQGSGHATYTPSSGVRDLSASLELTYALARAISLTGGLKATRLVGDAMNSPVVSSAQIVSGSLSVGYAF